MSKAVPDKYEPAVIEAEWQKKWEDQNLFAWDSSRPRSETFVVDTPPPTVSGSLHLGHVFSYTQTDVLVRQQRMSGKGIYYPMGWDDNGLPTERRVQNYFRIRCEPSLPYDPDFKPVQAQSADEPVRSVSRANFVEACQVLTKTDEAAFEHLWKRLGLSVDWSTQYSTIDALCRKISQISFLDLVKKGEAYNSLAPTMWDVGFRSAVAQAEVEDRPMPGAFHDIRFEIEGGGEFVIATTRPELIAACIAVTAHPEDDRYKHLFGKHAVTPLFYARVPILPSEEVDRTKGSGIMMICTFGDVADVQWWKKSGFPVKQIVGLDGRLLPLTFGKAPFESQNLALAQAHYDQLVGLKIKPAQQKTVELLNSADSLLFGGQPALIAPPKPITHPVKFFEKGDSPLEFIPTRQWYVKILDKKEALIEQGRKIEWHPEHMRSRYENWVQGLNHDWCISRQRYFGVPFPVWYPIAANGKIEYDKPIYATEAQLPVDPQQEVPSGYSTDQRDKPNGFSGDPDVMDTWATSSLTPQISSRWSIDPARHEKLFPADVRPQAHEIIRTWAFYTIVKAWCHHKDIPWRHVAISGWILDPDRKKMSKSKGNVVTPEKYLDEYSADAVRYWAARARLGVDTAFDQNLFKIGRKLSTKLFNANRFVVLQANNSATALSAYGVHQISEELDRALIVRLRNVVKEAGEAFANFDYANALQLTEDFFWNFCDNYVELVKRRAYQAAPHARDSAIAALVTTSRVMLRLFAPFQPYITEEIWNWGFGDAGRSVHTSAWPTIEELQVVPAPQYSDSLRAAEALLGEIRLAKSAAQKGLGSAVARVDAIVDPKYSAALALVLNDVAASGGVAPNDLHVKDGAVPEHALVTAEVILS